LQGRPESINQSLFRIEDEDDDEYEDDRPDDCAHLRERAGPDERVV
jgi:hypothetical protein